MPANIAVCTTGHDLPSLRPEHGEAEDAITLGLDEGLHEAVRLGHCPCPQPSLISFGGAQRVRNVRVHHVVQRLRPRRDCGTSLAAYPTSRTGLTGGSGETCHTVTRPDPTQ